MQQLLYLSKTKNPGEEELNGSKHREYSDQVRHFRVNRKTRPSKNAEVGTSASLYGNKFPQVAISSN